MGTLCRSKIFPSVVEIFSTRGIRMTVEDDYEVVVHMNLKTQKRDSTRCIRVVAWISIALILVSGIPGAPFRGDLRVAAEIPEIHDSSEPYETEWVLVGYRRHIEQDPQAMSRAYLALFCRQVGQDRYQFMFMWHDSAFIGFETGGSDMDVKDYVFMGMVFRDNGPGEDIDMIWDAGVRRHTTAGHYMTEPSGTIIINDWKGIRFTGFLTAEIDVFPSLRARLGGYALTLVVGGMVGLAWKGGPVSGVFGTLAGLAILTWYHETYLTTDHVNLFYHAFYGGLDLLNDVSSCVNVEIRTEYGYDLPDHLESAPVNRRHTGTMNILVQTVFPSKISLDLFMMSRDTVTGAYDGQAGTRIHQNGHGKPGIAVIDFPASRVNAPVINGQRRTLEVEWDLSEHFFTYQGFHDHDIQNYLTSGKFIPLNEQFDYLKSMGVSTWDIPTLQFQVAVEVDYELPGDMVAHYPASPLHTVFEDQKMVAALDCYTLGHLTTSNRIEVDEDSEYRVYLGDETILAAAFVPLIPVMVVHQLLRNGGIHVDMPGDLFDIVILPPWDSEVVGETLPDTGHHNHLAIADPERIVNRSVAGMIHALEQVSPIRSVTVPDPSRTIFVIIDPGMIPESLHLGPPSPAPDGSSYVAIDDRFTPWQPYIHGDGEARDRLAAEGTGMRDRFVLRAIPGVPGEDMTVIEITDPGRNYAFAVELPDGEIVELLTSLAPREDELGSVMIRDIPATVLIPDGDAGDPALGFVSEMGEEASGHSLSITPGNLNGDGLILINTPIPEMPVQVIIREPAVAGENPPEYASVITVTDPASGISFREPGDLPHDLPEEVTVIRQWMAVEAPQSEVRTYSPLFLQGSTPVSTLSLTDSDLPIIHINDVEGSSGLITVTLPDGPGVMVATSSTPEVPLSVVTRDPDPYSDDGLALVTGPSTTWDDGVIIRGTSLVPSDSPAEELRTWIVSDLGWSYRELRTRRHFGNYIYGSHLPDTRIEGQDHHLLVQHPGGDGEFFTLGSPEADAQVMMTSGPAAFIALARQMSDDLFSLDPVVFEETVLTVDSHDGQESGTIILEGVCNRLDATPLVISLSGPPEEDVVLGSTVMYGGYHIEVETGHLPGGLYECTVSDANGNHAVTWIEVANGGM